MADQGFYRTWKARIHAIPELKRFQQDGVAASYPIFSYTDDGLRVRHFYHAADQIAPNTMLIGPARILATLDYASGDIVDVNFEPFTLPLFEDVEYTLTAEEREARRPDVQRLEGLYDQVLATYPEPPDSDLVGDFVATLQRVVPPVLWPYYEQLLGDHVPASQ
jgi:hypothetical protein